MAELNIFGTKHIAGGTFGDIEVMGVLYSDNTIICEDLDILGKAYFDAQVNAKDVDIIGRAEFKGNIKCKNIDIVGHAAVEGNIDANEMDIVGFIDIKGDLNVDKLEVVSSGSKFNNIYGDKIYFNMKKGIKTGNAGPNIVNEIDATNITLKNVKCNKVSGENIKILDDVEVELVEYSNSLSISFALMVFPVTVNNLN